MMHMAFPPFFFLNLFKKYSHQCYLQHSNVSLQAPHRSKNFPSSYYLHLWLYISTTTNILLYFHSCPYLWWFMLRYYIWLSWIQPNFYRTYFVPVQTFNVTVCDLIIAQGSDSSVIVVRNRNLISANKDTPGRFPVPNVVSLTVVLHLISVINSVLETPLDGLHDCSRKAWIFFQSHTTPWWPTNIWQPKLSQTSSAPLVLSSWTQLQVHWGSSQRCYRVLRWVAPCPYLGERRGRLEPQPDTPQDTL